MPYGSKKNLRIALRQVIFEAAVNYKADKDISMSQLIAMALQFYLSQVSMNVSEYAEKQSK